jgi:hypothetical protein
VVLGISLGLALALSRPVADRSDGYDDRREGVGLGVSVCEGIREAGRKRPKRAPRPTSRYAVGRDDIDGGEESDINSNGKKWRKPPRWVDYVSTSSKAQEGVTTGTAQAGLECAPRGDCNEHIDRDVC